MNVLIIHYTPPGVVGGVEYIIEQHRRLLEDRGCTVEIVAGRAAGDRAVTVIPEIDVASRESQRVEAELAAGVVSSRFYAARDSIAAQLAGPLARADRVIVHNALTLHFSLPLTAVLWDTAWRRHPGTVIGWNHDLSWSNPLYLPTMHPGYPWDLLRLPAPHASYVTISMERREELATLWGHDDASIRVIPNGVDVADFLRLSEEVRNIAHRYRLFHRYAVLLLPVRVTRRKNIETAIRAVAELAREGRDIVFLISGPSAPHHPGRSRTYLDELKTLRRDLGLTERVIFLADDLGRNLSYDVVSQLYQVCDALLFPSSQEGFGLPILEAGLARVPVILSDIPIFREVGGGEVWPFSLEDGPQDVASQILAALDSRPARLRRRVLQEFAWEAIMERDILPLLAHDEGGTTV